MNSDSLSVVLIPVYCASCHARVAAIQREFHFSTRIRLFASWAMITVLKHIKEYCSCSAHRESNCAIRKFWTLARSLISHKRRQLCYLFSIRHKRWKKAKILSLPLISRFSVAHCASSASVGIRKGNTTITGGPQMNALATGATITTRYSRYALRLPNDAIVPVSLPKHIRHEESVVRTFLLRTAFICVLPRDTAIEKQ